MRRTTITAAAIIALTLCSCNNFLNVQPQGYVLPSSDEEFASIMHSILRDIEGGGDEFIVGNMETVIRLESCSDNLDANVSLGKNLPSYAGEVINTMQLRYRSFWPLVKDCNIVIENLEGRDGATARAALASAYAVKGILYYNLMRDYCEPWDEGRQNSQLGLPIVERFDIDARPLRSSLAETAEYMLSLMDRALALDPHDELFMFTEWVVKSYKAKMLFWTEDWEGCAALCRDILDNSGFRLTGIDSYAAMINSANEPLGEVIIRSHVNNSSELDWYFSAISKYLSTRPAAASLVRLYGDEPGKDVRYLASLDARRMNTKTVEAKLRLSEILLMHAECEYHLGHHQSALDDINLLRANRIYGAAELNLNELEPVRENDRIREDALGNSISPLLQLIFDERRKEFFAEGDRWYELKRNGRPEWWVISNGFKYTTRQYLYTAPIYRSDIENVPGMIQNEGYEK